MNGSCPVTQSLGHAPFLNMHFTLASDAHFVGEMQMQQAITEISIHLCFFREPSLGVRMSKHSFRLNNAQLDMHRPTLFELITRSQKPGSQLVEG